MKKHPVDGARGRVRTLRQDMTEAERGLWRILRSRQMNGYKFRRQVPFGRYIADFACYGAKLIIEIDGGQHDHSAQWETERTVFLQREGYRVLRFWNHEVLTNLDGVYMTITGALAASPPPQPSPIMGEGFHRA